MSLLLPVEGYTGISSWQDHQNRGTPSSEPGTDFYIPTGTPIIAPADGYIYGSGESVNPATGRWVGINFDNGMSFRSMHHSQNLLTSGRVEQGRVYALSGSSGYGSEFFGEPYRNDAFYRNTGGDHVHATLWPTHDHIYGYGKGGIPFTIDLMQYASPATPVPIESEEDDMKAIQQAGLPDSGIIIQAGVPPYAMGEQVFLAVAGAYGLTPQVLQAWQYETVVREQWTAFSTAQAFAANRELSQNDINRIATAIREASV